MNGVNEQTNNAQKDQANDVLLCFQCRQFDSTFSPQNYLVGNVSAAMDAPQLTSAQLGQGRGELREAGILGPNDMYIVIVTVKRGRQHII